MVDKWIAELSQKEIAIRRKETEDSHQEQLLFSTCTKILVLGSYLRKQGHTLVRAV